MAPLEAKLTDLEVIGYASVLDSRFVPKIVPPIFGYGKHAAAKRQGQVFMPPYRLEGDALVEGEVARLEDFSRAIRQGQVTRLEEAIPARSDHKLWIDECFQPQYQPSEVAEQRLYQLAHERAQQAQEALTEHRLDEALRLAQAAISADDGCLNALLVKACVHQLRGDFAKVKVLARIAEAILPGTDLHSWVGFFGKLIKKRPNPGHTRDLDFVAGSQPAQQQEEGEQELTAALIAKHRLLEISALDLAADMTFTIM